MAKAPTNPMSTKHKIDIHTLTEAVTKAKFARVPRLDYFCLLVKFSEEALLGNMYEEAWIEFDKLRDTDHIMIRRLYLEKMLDAYVDPEAW